jgi:hypothetical protein
MASVPEIPLRRIDDLIARIEDLAMDADRRGYETLVFFLDAALSEAMAQQELLQDGRSEADDPRYQGRRERSDP